MTIRSPAEHDTGARKHVVRTGAYLTALVLFVALFTRVVPHVSQLYPGPLPDNPYFVPGHGLLLYLLLPLVVTATLSVIMAPGVLLALAFEDRISLAELTLKAFAISFAVLVASFSALHVVISTPSAFAFTVTIFVVLALAYAVWAYGALYGGGVADFPVERQRITAFGVLVLSVLLVSIPVLFWQDINPDGLEGLSTGRSLSYHVLPRLPNGNMPGLDLGMVTMAYPIHWMIVFFGHIEVAARLPVLLYLALIYAGVTALIERGSTRRLGPSEEATIVLTAGVFAVTMIFSDTYHPYSTDVASPANIDLLAVGGMLSTAYFFFEKNRRWTIAFAFLTHLTRPTGVMFLVLLGLASLIATRRDLRWRVVTLAAALVLCLVWTVTYEEVVAPLIGVPIEAGTLTIARRLRFLRFDDVRRFLWVIVPAGILPAMSFFEYRALDESARVLLLVGVAYFLFFYILAFTALHHFAPVMVIPVVLFWRLRLRRERSGPWVSASALAAVTALILSLPASLVVDRKMRQLGSVTEYRIGDYSGDFDAYRLAYRHKNILNELFRPVWQVEDPATEMVGSPWVQIHYAATSGSPDDSINYLVIPTVADPPPGFTPLTSDSTAALYVRDIARWERDRRTPPGTDFPSPVYRVPKETLFPIWGIAAGAFSLDLREILPQSLLRRIEAER